GARRRRNRSRAASLPPADRTAPEATKAPPVRCRVRGAAAGARSDRSGAHGACAPCGGRRTSPARAESLRPRTDRLACWNRLKARSSQRLVKPMQQPRPRLERGDVELLVMGMRALAV